MTEMEEIKKREAIMVAQTIINMPRYKVLDHQTIDYDNPLSDYHQPKGTTDILVIYLKK